MPRRKLLLGNYTLWEKQIIAEIDSLSDCEVLRQLRAIMQGYNYSWQAISQGLKRRYDSNFLELDNFEPGNILYEWNVLCDERLFWERHRRSSFNSFRFNRACLTNLKTIPTQAGLGADGKIFTSKNVDDSTTFTNLTVGHLSPLATKSWERDLVENDRIGFGYFYHKGPEFKVDYIHERVEA